MAAAAGGDGGFYGADAEVDGEGSVGGSRDGHVSSDSSVLSDDEGDNADGSRSDGGLDLGSLLGGLAAGSDTASGMWLEDVWMGPGVFVCGCESWFVVYSFCWSGQLSFLLSLSLSVSLSLSAYSNTPSATRYLPTHRHAHLPRTHTHTLTDNPRPPSAMRHHGSAVGDGGRGDAQRGGLCPTQPP